MSGMDILTHTVIMGKNAKNQNGFTVGLVFKLELNIFRLS